MLIFILLIFYLEKKRRIKAAKALFRNDDARIIGYETRELLKLLANRSYHSPEISETDEDDSSKTVINVYNYSWRSEEVCLYFNISLPFIFIFYFILLLSFLAQDTTSKRS
jgi:hypothetical protein